METTTAISTCSAPAIYSKTLMYSFAQLNCKMRLQIVRNWNVNMFFYGWKIFLDRLLGFIADLMSTSRPMSYTWLLIGTSFASITRNESCIIVHWYSNLLLINILPQVLEPCGTVEKHEKRLLLHSSSSSRMHVLKSYILNEILLVAISI